MVVKKDARDMVEARLRPAESGGRNIGAANDRLAVDPLNRIAQDGRRPLNGSGAAGRNDQETENDVGQEIQCKAAVPEEHSRISIEI